jgi:protein TonB
MKRARSDFAPERLWWEIPLALVLMGSGLLLFSGLLVPPKTPAPIPVTLDAEIANIGLAGSAKSAPAPASPPKPRAVRKAELPKIRRKLPVVRPKKAPSPKPTESRPAEAPIPKTPLSTPQNHALPGPASPSKAAGPGAMDVSARAYVRPKPRIPNNLLGEEIDTTALARFHVAADGTSTVELIQSTNEPSLDRSILDALRKWRFQPAMRDGRPVASTVELRIPIQVR